MQPEPTLPRVGLVLPVFKGEAYIARNLRTVLDCFDGAGVSVELVVVIDGRLDRSSDEARSVDDPRIRVIEFEYNQGKGAAVTAGLEAATARYVGWLDSDLDIDPRVIVSMARRLDAGDVDIVVGSKRHPQSEVAYPVIRRVYSAGYQALVRLLVRVAVRDTQVGAKLMRREVADVVVPLLLVKRYAFDLEVLAVAAQFGFDRVSEAPIELAYQFTGTGIDRNAIKMMLLDTIAIGYRIHIRHWYVRRFASLLRERNDELALRPDHADPVKTA